MNKVEEYIKNHVKRDSNETEVSYAPWLTPDDARAIAQIAKEEVIEKACKFFSSHIHDNSGGYDREFVLNQFRKLMQEK